MTQAYCNQCTKNFQSEVDFIEHLETCHKEFDTANLEGETIQIASTKNTPLEVSRICNKCKQAARKSCTKHLPDCVRLTEINEKKKKKKEAESATTTAKTPATKTKSRRKRQAVKDSASPAPKRKYEIVWLPVYFS